MANRMAPTDLASEGLASGELLTAWLFCALKPELRKEVLDAQIADGTISASAAQKVEKYIATMTPEEKITSFVSAFILSGGYSDTLITPEILGRDILPELLPRIFSDLKRREAYKDLARRYKKD